jgi:hypothetical protein
MSYKLKFIAVMILLTPGCSRSVKHAQSAHDKATINQRNLTMAFFAKGWGMTRIAGSEANAKEVEIAKVSLLRSQLDGTFTPQKAEEILSDMGNKIAANEPYTSKSFAWLAFLLQQSELTQAMFGNVDFYLQSQHSIFEQVSDQVPGEWEDAKGSIDNWSTMLGELVEEAKKLIGNANNGK